MRSQNAPKLELDTFDGNPLNYHYFKETFVDTVESSVSDSVGRLARLIQHTRDEAKDLVKAFIHDQRDECYKNSGHLIESMVTTAALPRLYDSIEAVAESSRKRVKGSESLLQISH